MLMKLHGSVLRPIFPVTALTHASLVIGQRMYKYACNYKGLTKGMPHRVSKNVRLCLWNAIGCVSGQMCGCGHNNTTVLRLDLSVCASEEGPFDAANTAT